MKSVILLNANENTHQVEEEEKSLFVRGVLENIGLPLENVWEGDDPLISLQAKMKLRQVLSSYDVLVVDDRDGGLQIYVDKDMIAQWNKPSYILKKDHSQIDPKKKMFLEMHTDTWSVFENTDV